MAMTVITAEKKNLFNTNYNRFFTKSTLPNSQKFKMGQPKDVIG